MGVEDEQYVDDSKHILNCIFFEHLSFFVCDSDEATVESQMTVKLNRNFLIQIKVFQNVTQCFKITCSNYKN